jgi:hypothetical protein
MESSTFQITPFFLEIDGVTVQIVEVAKQQLISGEVWYIVPVKIIYKGIHSRVFPMFVKDIRELKNKLKVEITKVKIIDYSLGLEEVKRLIT